MNITATRCDPDCVMCRLRAERPPPPHQTPIWPSIVVCAGFIIAAWAGIFYAARWVLT